MATLHGEPVSIGPFQDEDLKRTFEHLKKATEKGQITNSEYTVTIKKTNKNVKATLPEIDFDN